MINKIEFDGLAMLMQSSSYKERFCAEYIQLKQRYEKLRAFNTRIEAAMRTEGLDGGVDEPMHDCPASLLREQESVMGEYLHLLEVRAVIEGVDLEMVTKALIEASYLGYEKTACCESKGEPPCEKELYATKAVAKDAHAKIFDGRAMGNDRFAELCYAAVVKYANERIDKTDCKQISADDVYIVWICKTLQNNKALLSTTLPDGMYYELTYNGDKGEIYLDAYKKVQNLCLEPCKLK